MPHRRGQQPADGAADTEAHKIKRGVEDAGGDDAEGHRIKRGVEDAGGDDDAEGHKRRSR
ncbi:MAG: hypothetical protein IT195_04595 [Microthrixaceae bacterium]|nr:hypothetical protein [Microthrixaceae bacterium]